MKTIWLQCDCGKKHDVEVDMAMAYALRVSVFISGAIFGFVLSGLILLPPSLIPL